MSQNPLGTTTATQIAIVVKDIEAKSRAWAELLGQPVPEIRETADADVTHIQYRGATTPGRVKLAFFSLGQVSLELLEPIGGPSTWQEQLDAHGDSLHHIAFRIEGMQDKLAYLDANGIPLVQSGCYKGGRYAYVDGTARLGAVLELLEND